MKKHFIKTYIPIIIGLTVGLIITYVEDYEMANYIGIIIALITVTGSMLANYFEVKRDGNKIREVKEDTSNMQPKIDAINENTKDTNIYLTRTVDKKIDNLISQSYNAEKINGEIISDLKYIAEEVKYKKRVEAEYMGQVSKEMLSSGIENLYKENALLTTMLKEYKEKNIKLERENALLTERNSVLNHEIEKLQKEDFEFEI